MMSKRGPLNVLHNDGTNNNNNGTNRLSVGAMKSRQSLGRDMNSMNHMNNMNMNMNHMMNPNSMNSMNSMNMNNMNGMNNMNNMNPMSANHMNNINPMNQMNNMNSMNTNPMNGQMGNMNTSSMNGQMGNPSNTMSRRQSVAPNQNHRNSTLNGTSFQGSLAQFNANFANLHVTNGGNGNGNPHLSNRRSSILPPMNSTNNTSNTINHGARMNPRDYMMNNCDSLMKFLLNRNFNAVPLSHHTLVENPSEIHTRQIFAFVYRQIDPAFPFPEKMNDWPIAMANALDQMRYPLANELPASKLSMATSPHVYPHFFAAIIWLMNLFHIIYESESMEESLARFTPGKFFYQLIEESFDEKVIQPKLAMTMMNSISVDDRIVVKVNYQNDQLHQELDRLQKMSRHFEEQLDQLGRLHPSLDSMRETRMKVEAAKQLLSHSLIVDQQTVEQTEVILRKREESLRSLKQEINQVEETFKEVQSMVDHQVIHIEHFDKLKSQLNTLLDEQSEFKRRNERAFLEKEDKGKQLIVSQESVVTFIERIKGVGLNEGIMDELDLGLDLQLDHGKMEVWIGVLSRVRDRLEMSKSRLETTYEAKKEEWLGTKDKLERMEEEMEMSRDLNHQQQLTFDRLDQEFKMMKDGFNEQSMKTSHEVIELTRKIATCSKDAQSDLQRAKAALAEAEADQENKMKQVTETFRYYIDKCYMPALEELVRFKQHIEAQLIGLCDFVKKVRSDELTFSFE